MLLTASSSRPYPNFIDSKDRLGEREHLGRVRHPALSDSSAQTISMNVKGGVLKSWVTWSAFRGSRKPVTTLSLASYTSGEVSRPLSASMSLRSHEDKSSLCFIGLPLALHEIIHAEGLCMDKAHHSGTCEQGGSIHSFTHSFIYSATVHQVSTKCQHCSALWGSMVSMKHVISLGAYS